MTVLRLAYLNSPKIHWQALAARELLILSSLNIGISPGPVKSRHVHKEKTKVLFDAYIVSKQIYVLTIRESMRDGLIL
jgi:hypothetical protein